MDGKVAKVGWEWYQPTTLHNDWSEVSPLLALHHTVVYAEEVE